MSQRVLNAAIVGAGRIALPAHGLPMRLHPQVRVAAVCDINEDAARRLAKMTGADAVFTDAGEMLRHTPLDFVSLCTPPWLHAPHATLALEQGVAVLVEKPLTLDPQASARLVKVAQKADRPLWVGYHKRFDPGVALVAQQLKSGGYGDCFHARFSWRGLWTMANVPAVTALKNTAQRLGVSTESLFPAWRDHDPHSPGAAATVFCHLVDLAVAFFGAPDEVHGGVLAKGGEKPDHLTLWLRYGAQRLVELVFSSRQLSFEEKETGVFSLEEANLSYVTSSNRQALLPARVWRQTAWGAVAQDKEITPVAPGDPRYLSAHYRKVDAFVKTLLGQPVDLPLLPCTAQDGWLVDKLVMDLLHQQTGQGSGAPKAPAAKPRKSRPPRKKET